MTLCASRPTDEGWPRIAFAFPRADEAAKETVFCNAGRRMNQRFPSFFFSVIGFLHHLEGNQKFPFPGVEVPQDRHHNSNLFEDDIGSQIAPPDREFFTMLFLQNSPHPRKIHLHGGVHGGFFDVSSISQIPNRLGRIPEIP